MKEVTVNVTCLNHAGNPSYRLYVDNDLLTERTWIWPQNIYIKEHLFVDIQPGEHTLRIEIPGSMAVNRFKMDNVTVDGLPVNHQNGVFFLDK